MKTKRQPIPQTEVLEWLQTHHPDLHHKAEVERSWVWLSIDLRGEQNKAKREAIKEYGFRFAKRGHPLPSGQNGTWAHCCTKPMPFKRKGSNKSTTSTTTSSSDRTDPLEREEISTVDDETLAFLNS
jgi:hypothetical protein